MPPSGLLARHRSLRWAFFIRRDALWQLDPRMATAVVHGVLGRRERGIGECSHGDGDTELLATLLGVEDGRSTHGAEPKPELGPVVACSYVFCGSAGDRVRGRKARECSEDASRPALARQAVTNPNSARLAVHLDPKLTAGASSCSIGHGKCRDARSSCLTFDISGRQKHAKRPFDCPRDGGVR